MKRFLATLALTFVLSGSALAGTIPTCGLTGDEPPTEATEPGHVPSTDYASSNADGIAQGPDASLATSILLTLLDLAF